eukprot:2444252-Prymnesium_polylepis.1
MPSKREYSGVRAFKTKKVNRLTNALFKDREAKPTPGKWLTQASHALPGAYVVTLVCGSPHSVATT